jgi:hypothetical protein
MILIGSTGPLLSAAEKAAASGRLCMWSHVLGRLEADGALGASLQVPTSDSQPPQRSAGLCCRFVASAGLDEI